MSKNSEEIVFYFVNKKFPAKKIRTEIKTGVDIYGVKTRMLSFFDKKVKPTITDFRLVTKGPFEDQEDDTIDDNYLDEKYDSEGALELFQKILDKKIYGIISNYPHVYFRTLQLKLSVEIVSAKNDYSISQILSFNNNSLESVIGNISKAINTKIGKPFRVFQNNDKLDSIDTEKDMKKYQKTGLKLFLYPIKANFKNTMNNKTYDDIYLKYDKPLIDYLSEKVIKKLDIKSTNLLFKIKKGESKFEEIDFNQPIHKELKLLQKEPIEIEIHDNSPIKIPISITLQDNSTITVNFENIDKNMGIDNFIGKIKQYFNIDNGEIELFFNDKKIDKKLKTKNFIEKTLILQYDHSINLQIIRKFNINGNIVKKKIDLNSEIKPILKEIAKEYDSHQSLISLMLNETYLKPSFKIYQYFIPPEKEILVKIDQFAKFINLEFDETKDKIGFVSTMKIKALRKTNAFKNIPFEPKSELVFFYKDQKLNEDKTFGNYDIQDNATIQICRTKCYIFRYKNDKKTIYGTKDNATLLKELQEIFGLQDNKFFIDHNGKIVTDENPISKYPNGTEFKVKDIVKLKFRVDNKNTFAFKCTEKVQIIIDEFLKKNKSSSKNLWILNEQDNPISPNDYIYTAFESNEPDYVFNVKAQEAREYTFQNQNGKFITEFLHPSMKIKDVLPELNKRLKKSMQIEDGSFIVFLGRVADPKSTLSDLTGNIQNDDDPLLIENETPELIEIELKFLIAQDSDKNFNGSFNFIKGTQVYNVHWFASQLINKDFESISLEANGEILNDDDTIDEDTEITVDLSQIIKNPEENKELFDTKKRISQNEKGDNVFRTQRIVQQKKVVKDDSSDDDEDSEDSEEEDEDIFEKGNGTYRPSKYDPEDVYTFKFKKIGGDEFELDFSKDVTVEEIKEKIAEDESTDTENITIFVGNQRLADFNKPTNLIIPKKVSYFSVKIIDLQNTVVCTRVKPK